MFESLWILPDSQCSNIRHGNTVSLWVHVLYCQYSMHDKHPGFTHIFCMRGVPFAADGDPVSVTCKNVTRPSCLPSVHPGRQAVPVQQVRRGRAEHRNYRSCWHSGVAVAVGRWGGVRILLSLLQVRPLVIHLPCPISCPLISNAFNQRMPACAHIVQT